MQACTVCGKYAVKDGLCAIDYAKAVWQSNTSIDNLGIFLFFKKVIPKAFKNFKYGIPFFHREIIWEVLRDEPGWTVFDRKVVIAAPRGSSKTTLLSKGLVLFCVLFKIKKYIVIASKTGRAAQKNIRWIRNVLGSSIVIAIFGDIRPTSVGKPTEVDGIEGKWTGDLLVLRNGVTLEGVGMGQQLRSSAEGEDVNRIDLFIADDTETDENTKTPDRRESNETWLFDTVIPSLDLETGTIVFINTLTHTESILAKLLKSDGWRKKFYQIAYNDESGKYVSLWPEKFTLPIIEAIRNDYAIVGRERSYYKEYHNLVRSDDGFNERWIHYYRGEMFHQHGRNWLRYIDAYSSTTHTIPATMTLGIDSAYSDSHKSDWCVLLPLAQIHDMRKFVLPYSRGKYSTFDDMEGPKLVRKGIISEALRMHEKYHFSTIVIDSAGTQIGLFKQLKKAFQNVERPPRIMPFRSTENKHERLKTLLQPEYEYGRIYHMAGMDDLMRELVSFRDTTDDILDALYNAIIGSKPGPMVDYDPIMAPVREDEIPDSRTRKTVNWMVL